MKKNKTYTVAQLNKMMHSDLPLWKLIEACAFIDICDCYEPTELPPDGTFDTFKEIEPTTDAEQWVELIKQYVNPTELTAELLNALIEKIVIHEATTGEDGMKEQQIDIYYRFIGKIE